MARYLLGEAGAKWLRSAMSQKAPNAAVGATRHIPSSRGDPDGFLHPFALQYAASAGESGEGESPSGAWVIWVPDGSLVIDGETVDLPGALTAADGYPDGWYDLTDIFDGDDPGDEWSLYLDATKEDPKFVIDEEDAENPVLIAQVSGKAVKGVVESALVFTQGGALFPWKVKLFDVTSGNTTTKHVGVWLPRYGCVLVDWFAQASGGWNCARLFIGCEKYSGATLTDATAAESADGVWADVGEFTQAARWVKCTIDPGNSGLGVISNLAMVSTAPEDSTSTAYINIASYYHDLRIAKINANGGVEQYVTGCVCVHYLDYGGGGGGGSPGDNDDVSVGGSGGIFAWTAATRTIGTGGCMVGRKWFTCTTGTGSGKADGLYQLKVTLSASGATLEVVSGVSLGTSPSGNISYIPIYQISNGKITADYRGAFVVPAYE